MVKEEKHKTSLAEKNESVFEPKSMDQVAEVVSNSLFKIGSSLGFSGLMGFAAGFAIKQAATVALTLVGTAFIGLQALAYGGYVVINWEKIKADCKKLVDVDRDGKLDAKDVTFYTKKALKIIGYGAAGTTGLSGGLYLGLTRT